MIITVRLACVVSANLMIIISDPRRQFHRMVFTLDLPHYRSTPFECSLLAEYGANRHPHQPLWAILCLVSWLLPGPSIFLIVRWTTHWFVFTDGTHSGYLNEFYLAGRYRSPIHQWFRLVQWLSIPFCTVYGVRCPVSAGWPLAGRSGASKLQTFIRMLSLWCRNWRGCLLVMLPAMGPFYVSDLMGGTRKTCLIGNVIKVQFLNNRIVVQPQHYADYRNGPDVVYGAL